MIKKIKEEKEIRYYGYFIVDSGIKIPFDISKEDGSDKFISLLNLVFPFEQDEIIWLGEESNIFLRANKVVGWNIEQDEE